MKKQSWAILLPLLAAIVAGLLALAGCGGSNPAASGGGGGGGGGVATLPAAPTGVAATAGNGQNTVSWTAVTGATSYNIYGGTASGSAVKGGTKIASATASPYTHSGLTSGTTYYYVVTAVNAAGESPASNLINATPSPTTPPAPPTGVTATTQNTTQVDVNWTNVTGATGYNIYRTTTSPVASSTAIQVNTAGPVAAGPFANTGLAPGTTYYYVVTALNANGASALSQEASAATTPDAPTGLGATPASSTQINLNWSAAAGAASYNVYRSTTAGFTVSAANKVGNSAGAAFNDTGLTANTAYYYKVTAVNAGGESVPSTEAMTTTPAPPPAPTGLTAVGTTDGTRQITLSWNPVAGATFYNIYWATTPGVTKASSNVSSGVTSPSFTHTGLTAGTPYYYVVTAFNSAYEESAISAEASATPVPQTVAEKQLNPSGIEVDYYNVYWSEYNGAAGTIKKAPINGGAITTLATASSPWDIAVDGTSVWWTEMVPNGAIKKVPVGGGTVSTMASGLNYPLDIVADGTGAAYFTEWARGAASAGAVYKVDAAGLSLLASAQTDPARIALDGTNVYWTEHGAGNVNQVDQYARAGGTIVTRASGLNNPSGIASITSPNIFCTTRGGGANGAGAIVDIPSGGGSSTRATGLNDPMYIVSRIVNWSAYVYWTEYAGGVAGAGAIKKMKVSTGDITTLATGLNGPWQLAVDGTSVYWTNRGGGTVMKVAN